MNQTPARARLVAMARHSLAHTKAGTLPLEAGVCRVPVAHYVDAGRFELERARIWRRLPLVLALSVELPGAGDGVVRAFVNTCGHRGALVGILAPEDFGEIDRSCHGLTALPCTERAGLVWVTLDPASRLDLDAFLCDYDALLEEFGFARWHLVGRRELPGPNWRLAYGGYLDLYHLPILHKNTFGADFPNRPLYHAFGPHQRVDAPNPSLLELEERPDADWGLRELLAGVWTIFPHVSIATFDAGGRGVLVSQLFPGDGPRESLTLQTYLMEDKPGDAQRAAAEKVFDLLGYVVREEDYATGFASSARSRAARSDTCCSAATRAAASASTAGSSICSHSTTPRSLAHLRETSNEPAYADL